MRLFCIFAKLHCIIKRIHDEKICSDPCGPALSAGRSGGGASPRRPAREDAARRRGPGRPARQRDDLLHPALRQSPAAGGFLHRPRRRRPAGGGRPERPGPFPRTHGLQRNEAFSRKGHSQLPCGQWSALRIQRQCLHLARPYGLQCFQRAAGARGTGGLAAADPARLVLLHRLRTRGDRVGAGCDPRGVAARQRRPLAHGPQVGRGRVRRVEIRPARRDRRHGDRQQLRAADAHRLLS